MFSVLTAALKLKSPAQSYSGSRSDVVKESHVVQTVKPSTWAALIRSGTQMTASGTDLAIHARQPGHARRPGPRAGPAWLIRARCPRPGRAAPRLAPGLPCRCG